MITKCLYKARYRGYITPVAKLTAWQQIYYHTFFDKTPNLTRSVQYDGSVPKSFV